MGIVACGVQGRSNLEALACTFDLKTVRAYDIDPDAARRYAADMSAGLGLDVVPAAELADAVKGLDIVVTSGPILKHPDPPIPTGWLAAGAFASAVDFDSYWQGDALREADLLATDDLAQMRYYRQVGYFQDTPEPYADLGELVAGTKPGRQGDDERTIAINLGLALEDMAVGIRVYSEARAHGIGTELRR